MRKAHRLKRRFYCAKGPNNIWHLDGYDKFKPFGFCIHGAVDGFSRKVIWLEVSDTNNDPKLIAIYYLDALKRIKKTPRILRCDAGTENSVVCLLQQFFRNEATDHFAGSRSVIVGRSTSNQRIERWWGTLRQQGIQWWINFFKDLRDSGRFNELDQIHCENLKFCFMNLTQTHLDRIAQQWNVHEIRPQHNSDAHYGKPDIMYFLPETFGAFDYGTVVDKRDVTCCKDMYSVPKRKFDKFSELAYLPPSSKVEWLNNFAISLEKSYLEEKECIVIGDFNYDILKHDNCSKSWLDLMQSVNFSQLVESPTRPDLQMPVDADSALNLFLELNDLVANSYED
ncbi:uncharacterized protein LOC132716065 [Ruditapes philippinarum]|uniref:uncharacterized protein LOC132716065 n=1 Tax=Ruditapes philippinarum TaxID=129788 RepID=UPI00295B76DC|nr:uncharacterized protein LOC132716065 [Ruditapes philippinarum]